MRAPAEYRARVAVPHRTARTLSASDASVLLAAGAPAPFFKAVSGAYREMLAPGEWPRVRDTLSFSGWLPDGRFVGCCWGASLSGIMKSPWLPPRSDAFLRLQLAALHLAGMDRQTSVCVADNYATLGFWWRMGYGADVSPRGKARAMTGTLETRLMLQALIDRARPAYRTYREAVVAPRLAPLRREELEPAPPGPALLVAVRLKGEF